MIAPSPGWRPRAGQEIPRIPATWNWPDCCARSVYRKAYIDNGQPNLACRLYPVSLPTAGNPCQPPGRLYREAARRAPACDKGSRVNADVDVVRGGEA